MGGVRNYYVSQKMEKLKIISSYIKGAGVADISYGIARTNDIRHKYAFVIIYNI